MKIVILGPAYPFRGGIAHHTTLLARQLGRRHAVRLFSFTRQYPARLFPGRTDRDPSRVPLDAGAERVLGPLAPWTWVRTARRIVAERPDLLIIPWWVPFWAPSLAAVAGLVRRWSGTRIVFICHNVLPHDRPRPWEPGLVRLALGRGDAFVVHSAGDAERLRRLLPRLAPGAIHRAALPALDVAPPADRVAARARLGLPEEAPVALFFGFVRPYKGLETLIEALPAVVARIPDLQLVVAGEFWRPAAALAERAERLGVAERVRFDDRYIPNEELGDYYAAADLLVAPYLEATQSGVVTLAPAYGLPVVASRVGGLPEAVEDGVTGLLVPPGDPAALGTALLRVLADPALAARLRAGQWAARERFGWEPLVALLETLALPAAAPARPGEARRSLA